MIQNSVPTSLKVFSLSERFTVPTLLLVTLQPIFRVISAEIEVFLYADDILLVGRGAKNEGLHQKLQVAVKAVGIGISAMMSNCFYCSPNVRQVPAKEIEQPFRRQTV